MADTRVQRRWKVVAVVIGVVAAGGAIAVLATVGVVTYLANEVAENELPSCDREPVVLEWTQREGVWRRSATFELVAESQTVQIDLDLYRDDGGVIQVGKTVYAIPAGESFPDEDESASTTEPFRGIVVGRGVDGVNEQVILEAGQWQLIVKGGASPAEVRWPC